MILHYDNIIYSLQKAGGISTYWTELISRLLRDGTDISFTELPNQNISRAQLFIPQNRISGLSKSSLLINRFRDLKLSDRRSDFIFHSSYNRITQNRHAHQVITIHDFVHEKYYRGMRRYLHLYQKNKAIALAEKILVVSENTKRDLMAYHPKLKEDQISVIHNGVSTDFFRLADKNPYSNRPYILFIGSRAYYKNFDFAVNVLAELPDFEFYIVGSPLSVAEQQLVNAKINNRWKVFTHVDNARLNRIYNDAYALIYPSSYEGFGIPLVEAMNTATPFVALNTSSIPEVAGSAGILLNQLQVDDFKEALLSIEAKAPELADAGLRQSAHFSWEKCYQQTVQVYKDMIK